MKALKMAPRAQIYLLGCDAYRSKSLQPFLKALRASDELLEALAEVYVDVVVAPDMRGEALKSGREGRPRTADGHSASALPPGPVENGAGQYVGAETVNLDAPAPFSPLEGGGAIKTAPLGRSAPAPLPSPLRADPLPGKPVIVRSFARSKPNPPRGFAALASVNASLFDTFKVRGGRRIGDLTIFEARKMAGEDEREARILRAVCDHVGNRADGGVTIRQAVSLKVLKRAVEQNMEASDAA